MLWVITCVDNPNTAAIREKVLAPHREYLGSQKKILVLAGEQANGGPLAVERGKRAHPYLHRGRRLALIPNAPFLRYVGAVGQQFCKNLKPSDDIRSRPAWKLTQRLQHAVDAPLGEQVGGGRPEMYVAGASIERRR